MKWLRNLWQVHLKNNLPEFGMASALFVGIVWLVLLGIVETNEGSRRQPSVTEQELIAIHDLIARQNTMISVMAATETRILHYAKPHKHPVLLCPECAEQIRKDSQVELTTEGLK